MKLAFCIFKYFPYGGLQRDFLRIADAAIMRGHKVSVYTTSWEGEIPAGISLYILPVKGFTNHQRMLAFAKAVEKNLAAKNYDAVIGFNKMPGLDFYFAGDVCFKERFNKEKSFLHKFLPRYRNYLRLEELVFSPAAKVQVFFLAPQQKLAYINNYATPAKRFHLLPAGIPRNLLHEQEQARIRQYLRRDLVDEKDQLLFLFVASDFYNKGLDRTLKAIAKLPEGMAKLVVIGGDDPAPYLKLAQQLNIMQSIIFLGKQDNLLAYMLAADVLLHPARVEAAGMVLLEAITAGLPIITTAICGYAFHVKHSEAGFVVPAPFRQIILDELLQNMLNINSARYRQHALCYADRTDLYSMAEKAISRIESFYETMA